MMLSTIVRNVTETYKFKNFDMLYLDLPIDKSKKKKLNFKFYFIINGFKTHEIG